MPSRSSSTTEADTKHSRLSPSGSRRWLKCRGSVGFIAKNAHRLPAEEPSAYADEGTAAHELARRLLLGKRVREEDWDDEMLAHIYLYQKHVQTQMGVISGARLHVEQRIPLFYLPSEYGTADVLLTGETTDKIIDLKYGEGVSIEAVRNPQLTIYLRSWIRHAKRRPAPEHRVELEIYQPRARDGRFVRRWQTTFQELDEFASEIQDTAHSILLDPDNQPFYPDEEQTCRWCPAKRLCTVRNAALFNELPPTVAVVPAQPPAFPKAEALTLDQVSRVLRHAGALRGWLSDVEAYAAQVHAEGTTIPNTKLVQGRGSRDWKDEKTAGQLLSQCLPREDLYRSSLLSPAQLETLMKHARWRRTPTSGWRQRVAKLIEKKMGSIHLVHESDPRPAVDKDGHRLLTEADKSLL